MNHEFKRMLELAGLTEIKVNKPKHFIKINLPFKSTDNIKIPIDDLDAKYDDLINDFIRINPQINPEFFLNHNGLYEDVLDTIAHKYNQEATIPEFYKVYFYWLWANLVSNINKFEEDELEERERKYGSMRNEFMSNAMNGKWLAVPGVTD
jgi:hypothetical protein